MTKSVDKRQTQQTNYRTNKPVYISMTTGWVCEKNQQVDCTVQIS